MPMWGSSYTDGFSGLAGGSVVLLLCLTAFGLLIWALLSVVERHERRADHLSPGALETLRRRYALGDMDEATFLRMREQLDPSSQMSADDEARAIPERVGAGAR